MVDSTRSLFVSVMNKDEVSSPLFTRGSLKLLEFEGEISSLHRSFRTVQFFYLKSILRNQETIISLTITCSSISVFHANFWKREPSKCQKNLKKFKLTSLTSFHFWLISNSVAESMQKVDSCPCVTHSRYVSEHIYTGPNQWQIQGGLRPPLFLYQTEAQRAGKIFWETGPPSYLRVWITAPPPYLKIWIKHCYWLAKIQHDSSKYPTILYTKLSNKIYISWQFALRNKRESVILLEYFIMSARLALWPELNLLGLSQPQGVH